MVGWAREHDQREKEGDRKGQRETERGDSSLKRERERAFYAHMVRAVPAARRAEVRPNSLEPWKYYVGAPVRVAIFLARYGLPPCFPVFLAQAHRFQQGKGISSGGCLTGGATYDSPDLRATADPHCPH